MRYENIRLAVLRAETAVLRGEVQSLTLRLAASQMSLVYANSRLTTMRKAIRELFSESGITGE